MNLRRGLVKLSLILLLSLASLATSRADGIAASAREIARLDAAWSDSALKRDAGLLASFYAEDAVVYPANDAVLKGRAAAQKYWGDWFASDPSVRVSWKSERAEVSASGDIGYVGGSYLLIYKGPDGKTVQEHGKTLSIWKRSPSGEWKAIQDMWNSDTR